MLALLFLIAGGTKLAGTAMQIEMFQGWGYTMAFMYLIGVVEVAGAILLIMLPTRLYGAAALMVIMLGAIYTHLAHQEGGMALVPLAVLLWLAMVVWQVREATGQRVYPAR